MQRDGRLERQLERLAIHDRQRAGQAQRDRVRLGIRRQPELRAAPREHLALGLELNVDFQADDDFVVHTFPRSDEPLIKCVSNAVPAVETATCRHHARLRPLQMPVGRPLEDAGGAQQFLLGEGRGQELQADRQAGLRQAAGNTQAGNAGQVGRDRVNVREVHGQRVGGPLAELEGRGRRGRADQHVHFLESRVEVVADQAADLQRLVVILVGVAGRERERARA